MARRRYLRLATVLGLGLVGLAGSSSNQALTQGRAPISISPSGNPQTIPPIIEPSSVMVGSTTDSAVGLTLSAPADGVTPALTGDEAVQAAWIIEGAPGKPTSVKALFGILNWGGYKDLPVWLLTYDGACVPSHGPHGSAGGCLGTVFNTVIDANTGEYIASFADGTDSF